MTDRKIKVALCLSGEPRSSMFCFPYIYESLINLGPDFKVDTYVHSWKSFRALDSYNAKDASIDLINNLQYVNQNFSYVYPTINKIFKDEWRLDMNFTERTNLFVNTFLMLSSITKCFNLITEPYDIFIRCRFDIMFNSKFRINNIINDILKDKYDIFFPQKFADKVPSNNLRDKELNDQLSIGNPNSVKSYLNILPNLPNLLESTKIWGPEVWLKEQMDIDNIRVNNYYVDYSLIRQTNVQTNNLPPQFFLDQ